MKNAILYIFLFLLIAGSAHAGEVKVIELTDGSIITGEVVSLNRGVYTVRSESLGTVTVEDSRVKAIRARGSVGVSSSSAATSSAEISSITEKMIADGEIMDMIQTLKNDPSFQKAMEDPAILDAVKNGDTAALMANPKFLEIMNNATVRDIQKKMQK
jgi:hypothetical protein